MTRFSAARFAATAVVIAVLAACATEPPRRVARRAPPEPIVQQPAARPSTDVYAYPLKAQSAEQQDRDRYECYLWAVRQTGFDPSAPYVPPHQRVRVVAGPPPGSTVAAGAVTGAVLGAVVSNPHNTGEGAAVGAVAGAIVGAAAESQQAAQARRIEQADRADQQIHAAQLENQAADYRRAVGACLEGRGYSVR